MRAALTITATGKGRADGSNTIIDGTATGTAIGANAGNMIEMTGTAASE